MFSAFGHQPSRETSRLLRLGAGRVERLCLGYKQMGGDAPLLAQVLTLQTIVAVVTMPVVIATVT
ncbi:MAG: hypothetical protein R3D69_07740 [Xanthobacteraceae bacterium]